MPHFETVLLATDGSPTSDEATREAVRLAAELGARLLIVSVVAADGKQREARQDLEANGIRLVARAKEIGVEASYLIWEGEPGESIVAAADAEGADLIVMGTRGLGKMGRLILGSVSDAVIRQGHCPVVVVRPQPDGVRTAQPSGTAAGVR